MLSEEFLQFAKRFHDCRYHSGDIAFHTWQNNLSHLRCFSAFLQQFDKQREEISSDLLQQYKEFCLRQGNRPVTVNRKLLPMVTALRQIGLNSLSHCYLPSKNILCGESGLFNGPGSERFLRDSQLTKVLQYYKMLPQGKRKDCLDFFFFSFHACGLRVSDIITLEWKHINEIDEILSKTMVKNRRPLVIPLSNPAMEILNRWKSRKGNRRFVFGLLPEDFNVEENGELEKAIDNKNRMIRANLNMIGRKLGLSIPLGMHTARHSFAIKALNSGQLNVHLISRLLGHSSVTVTEKVYATFLLPTLSHEVRTRLSFPEFRVSY